LVVVAVLDVLGVLDVLDVLDVLTETGTFEVSKAQGGQDP
jgi:hypothetical protein